MTCSVYLTHEGSKTALGARINRAGALLSINYTAKVP